MAVKYGKFQLPEQIKVDEAGKTATFTRFVAEPFERGFGHTVGNALRRIMLTSLEAPSIISILLEGVPHEYTAVEGIIEDMTHVILNLKKGLLRKLPTEENKETRSAKLITTPLDITQKMIDDAGGQFVDRTESSISSIFCASFVKTSSRSESLSSSSASKVIGMKESVSNT
jgi:DNA-directed RNA polymerase subunit alpha